MSEVPTPAPKSDSSIPQASANSRSPAEQIRLGALLGLLFLMIVAMWYDYKVARPAVESAYARVAKLNGEVNANSGRKYMTEKEVQAELQRTPAETFTENRYFVEVYSWRAGLPIKSHNYYAVYTAGTPHVFLTHYMTELDRSELSAKSPVSASETNSNSPDPKDVESVGVGETSSSEKKRRRPQGDSAVGTPEAATPPSSSGKENGEREKAESAPGAEPAQKDQI